LAHLIVFGLQDTISTSLSSASTFVMLIVNGSLCQDRTDARAKAKVWLISHVASMNRYDIEDARSHFGYLLPAEWGA